MRSGLLFISPLLPSQMFIQAQLGHPFTASLPEEKAAVSSLFPTWDFGLVLCAFSLKLSKLLLFTSRKAVSFETLVFWPSPWASLMSSESDLFLRSVRRFPISAKGCLPTEPTAQSSPTKRPSLELARRSDVRHAPCRLVWDYR